MTDPQGIQAIPYFLAATGSTVWCNECQPGTYLLVGNSIMRLEEILPNGGVHLLCYRNLRAADGRYQPGVIHAWDTDRLPAVLLAKPHEGSAPADYLYDLDRGAVK